MPLGPPDKSGTALDNLFCSEEFVEFEEKDPLSCVVDSTEYDNQFDESITEFIVGQADYWPGFDYPDNLRTGSIERSDSVSWILEVQSYYGFQPLTAYFAVNYMDRFLSCRNSPEHGWALQLLSVSCLSLAAKMEETMVPSLLDLQIEGTQIIFEPQTIQRMELLVLDTLDWRLRSVTPFTFIDFFAYKADPSRKYMNILVSYATHITLSTVHDIHLLTQCPSSIAAAAILCATDETPALALVNPKMAASWCIGLTEEGISSSYIAMQQIAVSIRKRKQPMILSQLRVTTTANLRRENSPPVLLPQSKRRKANDSLGDE